MIYRLESRKSLPGMIDTESASELGSTTSPKATVYPLSGGTTYIHIYIHIYIYIYIPMIIRMELYFVGELTGRTLEENHIMKCKFSGCNYEDYPQALLDHIYISKYIERSIYIY